MYSQRGHLFSICFRPEVATLALLSGDLRMPATSESNLVDGYSPKNRADGAVPSPSVSFINLAIDRSEKGETDGSSRRSFGTVYRNGSWYLSPISRFE